MTLRPFEQDVARLLADGLNNAEIAQELHLKPKTLEVIVSVLYSHYEIDGRLKSNRVKLAWAIRDDLQLQAMIGGWE
ncbi:MAG TPA: LuxR C-terminal-related transcriptional regulator [Dehalococcoidia bacterium]|nr:LuxR C-terminal-related transcriptional regulator [Dehalococcoidia bacterium]